MEARVGASPSPFAAARPGAIARLAEHNNPLLVRSDVARELETRGFTGVDLDDVRFCSMYVGASFYQLVADAISTSH